MQTKPTEDKKEEVKLPEDKKPATPLGKGLDLLLINNR